jgi:hypothetical protein
VDLHDAAALRYFRWRWNEDRGDEHADWGHSSWLWAEDGDGWSVEQWEVYDGRQVLHYDRQHLVDEYGALGDQQLEDADRPPDVEELSESAFRAAIAPLRPINR